jgi:hypothetical protein
VPDIETTYVAICGNAGTGRELGSEIAEGGYFLGLQLIVRGVQRGLNHQNLQCKGGTLLLGWCQSCKMSQVSRWIDEKQRTNHPGESIEERRCVNISNVKPRV